MKFSEIISVAKGERIRAGSINDIIEAGGELQQQIDELEKALAEAEGKRGARGFRGRSGLVTPPSPPMLQLTSVEILTVPQVDRYRDLLTELGCTIPTIAGLSADAAFALFASDLPTILGSDGLSNVPIPPKAATWRLVQLSPGQTYTLTRSSTAGKYTPSDPMGGEPQAVLMGSASGMSSTTQSLVAGDVTGSGSVAQITNCPVAQIKWAELGAGSGIFQPIVIPGYIPFF